MQELLRRKGSDDADDPAEVWATTAATNLGAGGEASMSRTSTTQKPQHTATPDGCSMSESSMAGTQLAGAAGGSLAGGTASVAMAYLKEQQEREFERKRDSFVESICSPSTRREVNNWVGRVFTMTHDVQARMEHEETKERRRRRLRSRSCCATSEAGLSGQTAISGTTGGSGTGTATTGTALLAAGGSIAGARGTSVGAPASASSYRRPKSANSDESLVVHNEVDEPLTVQERVQGYLAGRLPELDAHISSCIAQRTQALRKEVDEDIAATYLRDTAERRVFNNRTNSLRWQNKRHQVIQNRLDTDMPQWIMEAIQGWDAKKAMAMKVDVPDEELVYDYLTKRGSHIDTGKLPAEVPIFRTMHASYSLPSMWRDIHI